MLRAANKYFNSINDNDADTSYDDDDDDCNELS